LAAANSNSAKKTTAGLARLAWWSRLIWSVVREVFKRRYKKKIPALHIVLEAGHRNFGDARRIFLEVKKDFERYENHMLQTITIADKGSCGQLMMADFAAHGEYLLDQKIPMSQRQKIPASMKIPKGMTGWTNIKVTPSELAQERAKIIEKATPKRGPNAPASASEPVSAD
jgi:hypothetical protein